VGNSPVIQADGYAADNRTGPSFCPVKGELQVGFSFKAGQADSHCQFWRSAHWLRPGWMGSGTSFWELADAASAIVLGNF
jgi:hypothetical protein